MSGGDGGAAARATMALAAAGIAAVIGVATMQRQRASIGGVVEVVASAGADTGSSEGTALLRLQVPQNWRGTVANDVFVEKTIEQLTPRQRLIVFVTGPSRHDTINFVSDLYNLTWDIACLKGKPELDVRIIGENTTDGARTWEDLVRLPDITAVFVGDDALDENQLNALRSGLQPVVLHHLGFHAQPYFRDDMHYFEDERTPLADHDIVMLGGTFDQLHNGHKKLLSLAVSLTKHRMIVGITGDEMLKKKKNADLIESVEIRQEKVRAYIAFLKPSVEVEFAVLVDANGPAIEVPDVDAAIVVSTETVAAMPKIQEIRKSRGLPPLKIFVCRRTDGSTLSSSFLREQRAASRR